MRTVKELAFESLQFAKDIGMRPIGWKVGKLEWEQIEFERLSDRVMLMGLPVERTNAPSQFDIVLR
jgi:hypothetical protein